MRGFLCFGDSWGEEIRWAATEAGGGAGEEEGDAILGVFIMLGCSCVCGRVAVVLLEVTSCWWMFSGAPCFF